jgi:putative transposase
MQMAGVGSSCRHTLNGAPKPRMLHGRRPIGSSGYIYIAISCPEWRASAVGNGSRSRTFLGIGCRKLDGTTFSNFLDKGDYDSSANAVISFDAYMEIKHLFLVDLLAREPNSSRHNTPIKLWELGVKNYPPAMPRCARDLRVLLGKIEVRVITNSGIAFECLAYNSEELKFLRHELDGEVVKFKYDPVDISVIHVYDPRKDIYITVPALDQAYAKGLSLWQHQVIKRYAREELNMDPEELAVRRKAKKKIQDIVDREWIQSGKSDTKRRLARYMGIRQPDYDSVLEVRSNQPPAPETQAILGPEAQPPPSVIPLMMTSNSDFQGASDFDENLVPDELPEGSQEILIASSESGTIEIAQSDGTDKNKRKPSKKDQTVDPHSAESPQAVGPPADEDWDNDDVDTTGFNASFNLPKEETIESSTFHGASN